VSCVHVRVTYYSEPEVGGRLVCVVARMRVCIPDPGAVCLSMCGWCVWAPNNRQRLCLKHHLHSVLVGMKVTWPALDPVQHKQSCVVCCSCCVVLQNLLH